MLTWPEPCQVFLFDSIAHDFGWESTFASKWTKPKLLSGNPHFVAAATRKYFGSLSVFKKRACNFLRPFLPTRSRSHDFAAMCVPRLAYPTGSKSAEAARSEIAEKACGVDESRRLAGCLRLSHPTPDPLMPRLLNYQRANARGSCEPRTNTL